jgi:hypothetical protein
MKIKLYTSLQGIKNLKEGRESVGFPERTMECSIEMSVGLENIKFNGDYMLVKHLK